MNAIPKNAVQNTCQGIQLGINRVAIELSAMKWSTPMTISDTARSQRMARSTQRGIIFGPIRSHPRVAIEKAQTPSFERIRLRDRRDSWAPESAENRHRAARQVQWKQYASFGSISAAPQPIRTTPATYANCGIAATPGMIWRTSILETSGLLPSCAHANVSMPKEAIANAKRLVLSCPEHSSSN